MICALILVGVLLAPAAQQPTKEETARGLYNAALLTADRTESDKLLTRIILDFPTTVAATEAIRLQGARLITDEAMKQRATDADYQTRVNKSRIETELKRRREESLGGYEISEIESHGLRVPIPNNSSVKRSGTNPEIIKVEASRGTADDLSRFYITTLPEFKWKGMGIGRCWTQDNPKTGKTERLCYDPDGSFGKGSLYVTTLTD